MVKTVFQKLKSLQGAEKKLRKALSKSVVVDRKMKKGNRSMLKKARKEYKMLVKTIKNLKKSMAKKMKQKSRKTRKRTKSRKSRKSRSRRRRRRRSRRRTMRGGASCGGGDHEHDNEATETKASGGSLPEPFSGF